MPDTLYDVLVGKLTPQGRVWGAVAPALVVLGYAGIGLLVYTIRNRIKGRFHDKEISSRGASFLLGMATRQYFTWLMQPLWAALRSSRLPATAITTLSVLLATGAAIAVGAGRFSLGGWMFVGAGLCDFFDGRIARLSGTAGPRGAALDSVLDRFSDGVILLGFAWYYRATWVLLPVGLLMISSFLVSYVRARGEALGVDVKVGLMQRPERVAYLGLGTAFSPILEALYTPYLAHPPHWLAVLTIILLAATTSLTAVRRTIYLLRALGPRIGPRWLGTDRGSLVRFCVSSAVATATDFAMVVLLVSAGGLTPWVATFVGCGIGALVNFTINRLWAFDSSGHTSEHLARYGVVSGSSALLNAGGISVLLLLPRFDYRVAWLLARAAVFLTWNYPLNRDYVFGTYDPPAEPHEEAAPAPAASSHPVPPGGLISAQRSRGP